MYYAHWAMTWKRNGIQRVYTSKQYEICKSSLVEASKLPKSNEHIESIRKYHQTRPDSHNNAIREGIKNRNTSGELNGMFDKTHSNESRNKMSQVKKEKQSAVGSKNSQYGIKYTWINDGITNRKHQGNDIPFGWSKGRKPYTKQALENFAQTSGVRKRDSNTGKFISHEKVFKI
jgi:hypothetical protein